MLRALLTDRPHSSDWRTLGNDVYVRAYGYDPSCILQKFAREFCSVWPSWGVFFAWLDANKECGWSAAEIAQFREDLKVIEPFARQCIDQSYLKVKQYVVRYLRVVDEGVNVTPRSGGARVKIAATSEPSAAPGTAAGRSSKPLDNSAAPENAADVWGVTREEWMASIIDSPLKSGQSSHLPDARAHTSSQEAPASSHNVAELNKAAASESREHTAARLGSKRKASPQEEEEASEALPSQQAQQLPCVPSKSGDASLQEALRSPQLLKCVHSDERLPPATPKKRRFESTHKEVAAKPSGASKRRSTRVTRAATRGFAAPPRTARAAAHEPARRVIAEVVVPMCDEEEELAVEALVSSRDSTEEIVSRSASPDSSGEEWSDDEDFVQTSSPLQIMRPMSKRTAVLAAPYPKRKPASSAASGSGSRRA